MISAAAGERMAIDGFGVAPDVAPESVAVSPESVAVAPTGQGALATHALSFPAPP